MIVIWPVFRSADTTEADMRIHILAASVICLTAGAAVAQNAPSPSSAAGLNTTCDQWNLSGQTLASCRGEMSAAASDLDRQRIRAKYQNGMRGSSTPRG